MMIYDACLWAPLIGFLIVGLFGKKMGDRFSNWISCLLMALSWGAGIVIFYDVAILGQNMYAPIFQWIRVGHFSAVWAAAFDPLSAVMVLVVTTVSFLVHIYSVSYMRQDDGVPRFMAYLGLFTFMMLMLVTSDNLLQLFFGWEGVGLASYLLIGFWYQKDSACHAGIKAFVVNRVGDLGLVLAIGAIYFVFKTIEFDQIFDLLSAKRGYSLGILGYSVPAFEVIGCLLLIGAMGKSAQLGLHTWLPDAMEGPTPVSALIHAATMVTAGVFLLVRFSPLLELAPMAKNSCIIVGATTALFAGTIGLVQNDIKRVIAYSTCSQLGYMFFAVGLGAYHLAIFHLVTHAFFKALLFLGAGSVIHALSDEQDMRFMGGIWSGVRTTASFMIVGNLALCGIPFFAGYYSKDGILDYALGASVGSGAAYYAYIFGLVAAFLTALYSFRLFYLTFLGAPRAPESVMERIHESGPGLLIPLAVLSIGAIFGGYLGAPYVANPDFWRGSLVFPNVHFHDTSYFFHYLPVIVSVFGLCVGYVIYHLRPTWPAIFASKCDGVYRFLMNKWYIDRVYDVLFVRSSVSMGLCFFTRGDQGLIDHYGPSGLTRFFGRMTTRFSQIQNGFVSFYAMMMGAAIAGYLAWNLW